MKAQNKKTTTAYGKGKGGQEIETLHEVASEQRGAKTYLNLPKSQLYNIKQITAL